jgi:hypothetical protein
LHVSSSQVTRWRIVECEDQRVTAKSAGLTLASGRAGWSAPQCQRRRNRRRDRRRLASLLWRGRLRRLLRKRRLPRIRRCCRWFIRNERPRLPNMPRCVLHGCVLRGCVLCIAPGRAAGSARRMGAYTQQRAHKKCLEECPEGRSHITVLLRPITGKRRQILPVPESHHADLLRICPSPCWRSGFPKGMRSLLSGFQSDLEVEAKRARRTDGVVV